MFKRRIVPRGGGGSELKVPVDVYVGGGYPNPRDVYLYPPFSVIIFENADYTFGFDYQVPPLLGGAPPQKKAKALLILQNDFGFSWQLAAQLDLGATLTHFRVSECMTVAAHDVAGCEGGRAQLLGSAGDTLTLVYQGGRSAVEALLSLPAAYAVKLTRHGKVWWEGTTKRVSAEQTRRAGGGRGLVEVALTLSGMQCPVEGGALGVFSDFWEYPRVLGLVFRGTDWNFRFESAGVGKELTGVWEYPQVTGAVLLNCDYKFEVTLEEAPV